MLLLLLLASLHIPKAKKCVIIRLLIGIAHVDILGNEKDFLLNLCSVVGWGLGLGVFRRAEHETFEI